MKTFIRILKWFLLIITAMLLVFFTWVMVVPGNRPPEITDLSSLSHEREDFGDTVFILKNNWLKKSGEGLWEMYVEGEPFERGVAFGKLTKELLHYQESAFVSRIRELVPSEGYLKVLRRFIAWFNRNLDSDITEEYRQEIYGTSFSASDEFNFIGSPYARQLNYHAAHDIGHTLQSLMMTGCTSFSVWDELSSASSLIVGRNFDFFAGEKFGENKIVCFFNPSAGYRFMTVSWADMSGVVSGMNEAGLTVTINAGSPAVPFRAATPVSLLAREILQYASCISEAYGIASKRRMFVSESFLIGSAKDGKSAIIEKTPHRMGLVMPGGNSIVCSNHFQGDAFSDDAGNLRNIERSDSKHRYDRMQELITASAPVDIPDAAAMLRDMKGTGNREIGYGNPLAINQLIAHHSVIFEPEKLVAWVSTSPWQLGEMHAYDLKRIFSLTTDSILKGAIVRMEDMTIPTDTFLHSADFRMYGEYVRMTAELKTMEVTSSLPGGFEEKYIMSNPNLYSVYSNIADYFYSAGEFGIAAGYYERSLQMALPGEASKKELTRMLEKSKKKSNAGKIN